MTTCSGCQRQQPGTDVLCLACIEDLSAWLRQIPDLFSELDHVRLPGSVPNPGPRTRSKSPSGSASPVRLEVLDLLDRGVVFDKLEAWAGPGGDVTEMCDRLRHHLFSVHLLSQQEASDFYRCIKGLCRDLGRVVGEPQELPIGKCSRPDADGFQCRGQLFRTTGGNAVYCRRCGDKPELKQQAAWVTLQQAATLVGKPIETVRTWYKRGRLGYRPQWLDHSSVLSRWSEPIGPQPPRMAWLPTAVRLANEPSTTLQHSSGSVNHGSGAELSAATRGNVASPKQPSISQDSDADVLGRVAPGTVTPLAVATAGTVAASDPSQTDHSQGGDRGQAGDETPASQPVAGVSP